MTCLRFTPDAQKIVTASADNTLRVVELRTNKVLHEIEFNDLIIPSAISKFTISPNGKYLVIGGHSGTLFVFNMETGDIEEAYDEEHNVHILGVDWAPGSVSTVASMDKSGLLYMWA